ncbi:hypothetical protein CALCODRAFT_489026 [Calocera cornea HHB12733]|uniref:Uncharacterized protein n=1 Tax=Calocera cornea HHB12733 TaxID=1353952 RepID=A0A165BZX5_9BASI|nr:hypothetical protein CALCODRAFT_489026 [Calocera cornea HHB12733]
MVVFSFCIARITTCGGQSEFATRLLGECYPSWYNKQPYKFIVTRLPSSRSSKRPASRGPRVLSLDSIILKVALAYGVAFNASSLFVRIWIYILPNQRSKQEVFSLQQHNGTGGTITKRVVLLVPTTLLVSFSLATSLRNFSMTHAPWYQNKATFYVVIPGFEILVLTLFPAARLDGLFYLYAPDEVIRQGNEMEMSCRPWVCLYHYFDLAGSQFMLH